MSESFSLSRRLEDINPDQWNDLAGDHPLVRHEFLLALDQADCAVARSGWAPHYLLLHRNKKLAGAMPLYLKSHSRGEYVFDAGWAQAFAQHGLEYYPKLLGAIPFTPVPGPRLLARTHSDRVALARQAIALTQQNELSSLHVLFPSQADREALLEAGFIFRENVQFHWHNRQYKTLDDFLANLSQQKRKKIKQDRKKAIQAGVVFQWLQGKEITDEALAFFYKCYCRTYLEHGNAPYLNYDFFSRLHTHMAENLVLVVALQNGKPIACALNIRSGNTLYGRYWGATQFISGLHFETCYIQAIEFCITHQIAIFEGGAQGEHKLSRGMLPVITYSAHWIRDARYARAIADFLARETPAIQNYMDELQEHSPFKDKHPILFPNQP
ncbi:MAG TPA: GNAT family N-acetyltransferase [Eoetvoesiella sp.]